MTYPEQLNTNEWKKKRQKILDRDGFKCQNCYNKKFVEESDSGLKFKLFTSQQRLIVGTNNIGEEKSISAEIKEGCAQFLNDNVIIYSRYNPKWRRIVLGLRKMLDIEKIVFEKYETKIKSLDNSHDEFLKSFDINLIMEKTKKEFDLREQRRLDFIELKSDEYYHDFEWLFLLGLHVHHKYYIRDLMAWEYNDDALITLCESCHKELHKNQTIPIYNDKFELVGKYHYCIRCHGAGVFPEYSHVQSGICFRCDGERYEELNKSIK